MSTGQTEPLILVIESRDEFLHVFQNGKELFEAKPIGTGQGENPSPIEFFDSDGYRLAGIYNHQWQLVKLIPATRKPDLRVLLQRVRNVIDNLRSPIEKNEDSAEFDTAAKEALLQLSRVRTSADLREYLQAFFPRRAGGKEEVESPEFEPVGIDSVPAGWNELRKRAGHW